jgi:hypothetical protein
MTASTKTQPIPQDQQDQTIHEIALETAKITLAAKNAPSDGKSGSEHLLADPRVVAPALLNEYLTATKALRQHWDDVVATSK